MRHVFGNWNFYLEKQLSREKLVGTSTQRRCTSRRDDHGELSKGLDVLDVRLDVLDMGPDVLDVGLDVLDVGLDILDVDVGSQDRT